MMKKIQMEKEKAEQLQKIRKEHNEKMALLKMASYDRDNKLNE